MLNFEVRMTDRQIRLVGAKVQLPPKAHRLLASSIEAGTLFTESLIASTSTAILALDLVAGIALCVVMVLIRLDRMPR